jgi:FlaA1/EpsC-like NDP-sugar epimerase
MADMRRDRVLVFGAGAGGRQFARFLKQIAPAAMTAIVDNDPGKQGTRIESMAVQRFEDVPRDSYDLVVIASLPGRDAIATQLSAAGLLPTSDFVSTDEVEQWYALVAAADEQAA